MKLTTTGNYDPTGIKYFDVSGLDVDITCPHCNETYTVPLGDNFIEYPKRHNRIEIDCWNEDCEAPLTLIVDLEMTVKAECEVKAGWK